MAFAPIALTVGSAAMQAYSTYQQGQAASKAAAYQAQVAENNAKIAEQNAEFAGAEGEANVGAQGLKTRAQVGAITSAQAANGINVHSGSAVNVRASQAQLGELDALNIRANAAREAYGYRTQAQGYESQAALDKATSKNAKTGAIIGAGATLLHGASKAALNFANFQDDGGFSTKDLEAGDSQFLAKVHGNG